MEILVKNAGWSADESKISIMKPYEIDIEKKYVDNSMDGGMEVQLDVIYVCKFHLRDEMSWNLYFGNQCFGNQCFGNQCFGNLSSGNQCPVCPSDTV